MDQAIVTCSDGSVRRLELQRRDLADGFEVTLPKDAPGEAAEYVDFMPDYSPANEGEDGYFAFNNNLVRFKNHEDGTYDTGYCFMHFFGVKTGSVCFTAVISSLWEQHSLIVSRRNGVYTIHPRFLLEGVAAEEDMKVEYHFLTGADADYSGMARVYRAWQLSHGICVPIRQRMNDDLAYVLDAPEVRIRMGWKPVPTPVEEQTPETEPPMHTAITFDGVQKLMEACKAQGIDKAEFCLVGWNLRGHDGRWPQAFPVEEAFGGETGLRRLIREAQKLGYRIVCHTNSTDCYSVSDKWDESLPMRTRSGEKQKNAQWGGGRMYNMCPKSGGEAYSYQMLDGVADLGFKGLHYIDVISTVPPRRCFDREHPVSQREFSESMQRIGRYATNKMGGFQSEGGYDYMAPVLDMALYVDFHIFDAVHPLIDENVPLWQIVYHDIILSNPGTATVNYPTKGWKNRLKFIEYGGHPVIYVYSKFLSSGNAWMGDEDFTCDTPEELRRTVLGIRQLQDDYRALGELRTQAIVRHEILNENIRTTTYEGGTRIVCNYGETPFTLDGVTVAPHEYEMLRP